MDNKTMTIIGVVVVAIIVIAAAAFVLTRDKGKDTPDEPDVGDIGTYVPIYGNANNDLYIDSKDIAVLQAIIDEDFPWDKSKMPFADANQDGQITALDIQLVQKIINRESCTVYYLDYYGEVEPVKFPIVSPKIAVTYYQQAEACNILGLMDNIVCSSLAAAGQYRTLYPHLDTLNDNQVFGTTGSSTLNDDAVEKIVSNKVTLVVSTPSSQNQEPTKRLREEQGINTFNLWYNGAYCYSTLMTLAIFTDRVAKVESYMSYCDNVIDMITSKLPDSKKKDILLMDSYYTSSAKYWFIASDANGSFTMINRYLANVYSADDASQFGFVQRDIDWLLANQAKYDAIVVVPTPCGFRDLRVDGVYQTGDYYSRTDYNAQCEVQFATLDKTDAYKDGNLIVSSYDNTFGYSTYAMLPVIAAQLYPDLFDLSAGLDNLQLWFNKINPAKIDVRTQGAYTYNGYNYDTSYPLVPNKGEVPMVGEIGTYVPIFGNANADLYIDANDLKVIEAVIDGELEWTAERNMYVDANNDGKVDQDDLRLVKDIIARNSCTVYYLDYYGEVEPVKFPIVDPKIAVTYYQQAEACNILGLMDNIVCSSLAAAGQYCTLYPHLQTLSDSQVFGTTGSSTLNDDAVEKIVANKVDLIVNTPSSQNQEPTKRLREEQGINTFNLWYNGAYCYSTLMTLAIFTDNVDKVEAYMDYCDGIVSKLTSKITSSVKKDILLMDSYYTSSAKYWFIASDANGSFTMINRYLANVYSADDASQFGFVQRDIDWLLANQSNYDAIVIAPTPCGFRDLRVDGVYQAGDYYSRADYNGQCETQFATLDKTDAYKSGSLVITSYDNTFGYSTYAMLPMIAAQLYPELFSVEDALEDLQEWFDTINKATVDVKTQGAFSYTGTAYETNYPQV